ncbi:hypothetical protein PENSPDRAFT_691403 [Peniophora sp. CONT]|nr:hypothetical protein PENSPDRAFT_691403 [Peniophora sp. CONT]
MAPLTSIRTSDDKIEIVNQRVLPHTVEWRVIDTIEQAHAAIKTMQIRGAPAIACGISHLSAGHTHYL